MSADKGPASRQPPATCALSYTRAGIKLASVPCRDRSGAWHLAGSVYKSKRRNRPLTPPTPFPLGNHSGAWPIISTSETSSNPPFLSIPPACPPGNPSHHSPKDTARASEWKTKARVLCGESQPCQPQPLPDPHRNGCHSQRASSRLSLSPNGGRGALPQPQSLNPAWLLPPRLSCDLACLHVVGGLWPRSPHELSVPATLEALWQLGRLVSRLSRGPMQDVTESVQISILASAQHASSVSAWHIHVFLCVRSVPIWVGQHRPLHENAQGL